MSTTIEIRPYVESDRGTLCELTVAAFEGVSIEHNTDRLFGPLAARDWRWRKTRAAEVCFVGAGVETLVAINAKNQPIGYVSLRFDRDARIGRIPDLVVQSGERGQGIGRNLLECALERFRAEGMVLARIETLEQNAIGQHLYPSLGFQEVGRQIHYARALETGPGTT
jgi:ribosomal protein S18 acetylase RimI-like enzyme